MTSWGCEIGCALISLAFLSCHHNQHPESAEQLKQQLLALENRWLQVENDPVAVDPILAPDFLHVVPGAIATKDQHLQFLREHPATNPRAEKRFEDLHVRIYGEAGVVNGVVVKTTDHGERKTLFTDVFALRDGRWRAVSAQELPFRCPISWTAHLLLLACFGR